LDIPVIGCQDPGKPSDEVLPPEPGEQLVAGPPHAVQVIADTAVLGFRNDAGVLRAGYATHDVAVQDAIVELTPYHYTASGRQTGGPLGLETGAIMREDGTEQAWRFDTAPEGSGDLTVDVQVTGQSFVSATDSGLHFKSSAG